MVCEICKRDEGHHPECPAEANAKTWKTAKPKAVGRRARSAATMAGASQFTGGLRESSTDEGVRPLEKQQPTDFVEKLRARVAELNPIDCAVLTVNVDTLQQVFERFADLERMITLKATEPIREGEARAKKLRRETQPARWARLCSEAEAKANELKEAYEELESMRSDCENKRDRMGDGLQATPYGEKLGAIADLDLASHVEAAEAAASEASDAGGMDWPLGFGRD